MIEYRDAFPDDAAALADMARRCFVETFGPYYAPHDMDSFLEKAFGPAGLPAQVGDPAFRIRLAFDEGRIAGFCKAGAHTLPTPPVPDGTWEVKQLYILQPWQGSGVADTLMAWAIETARAAGAAYLALSVWVNNHRAHRFYERFGLAPIGYAPFVVGSHVDNDPVWGMAL